MSPERHGEEQEKHPYYHAVRFQKEGPARRAYFAAQDTIHEAECNLSAYRFLLNGIWHVAVVGEPPPSEIEEQLARTLRAGDPVKLPDDVLKPLAQRGENERSQRLWTERHYRWQRD